MMHRVQAEIGGQSLEIETGKLAQQANGAVAVRYGDTEVLVTACASKEQREGANFFPLTVDYEERLYAAGKIPGGYIKREGRPSEDAVLASRLTDRPIRPLFPKAYKNDVQVIITVLSTDQENDPDTLAIIGASAALCISDIPFNGPVSAVRMGYVGGQLVLNPTFTQLQQSRLDLVVAGTKDAVVMVEAGASEIAESIIVDALKIGQEANQQIIALQEELVRLCGQPKQPVPEEKQDSGLEEAVASLLDGRLNQVFALPEKAARERAVAELQTLLRDSLGDGYASGKVDAAFEAQLREFVRRRILEEGLRPDGRGPKEVRPVSCEVGTLPRTHGSGLFTRGETQVLTIATLGSVRERQIIDGISQEEERHFMHHYNFPPFSVGEVRRLGSPGRREIGHGRLAERALAFTIPDQGDFPYTIRLVSEVLSSNGSTSMASVCGSTLSLMDAGVPIKAPVAGVAMGLVMGEGGKYSVLTDIEGMEDAWGDIDFKVAGTAEGVTALQMDVKIQGITYEIMEGALAQAKEARRYILSKMLETIQISRPELSQYAPRMYKITIHPDKIRNVIGPGGKTIRSITDETKVTIDIEDDGTVLVGSPNEEAANRAIAMIQNLVREVEVGSIYTGKVTRLMNFGAFVEILPGKEGLVHISELADYRVPSVEDVVKVGDEIMVMVTEIDRQGRINLSRRAVLEGATQPPAPKQESTPAGGRGGRRISPLAPRSAPSRPEKAPFESRLLGRDRLAKPTDPSPRRPWGGNGSRRG